MVRIFIQFDGNKYWYLDHQHHRSNGPAIQWADGCLHWYWYGQRHRVSGPSIITASGRQMWFWYGQRVTDYEHMMISSQEIING